jgi:uncharacterized protein YbjT (DUF2867 family)
MRVLIFGTSGMVGQGVLRECLQDPGVEQVRSVGRSATGIRHPKLSDLVPPDLWDYTAVEGQLVGYDACFFCLGVSSAGMPEADYERVTYGITVAAARTLARLSPAMTFIYVSGAGTDGTGRGRVMWARVKGRTENALLALPFKAAYMLRPGLIQPLHGARSKTASYRLIYTLLWPFLSLARWLLPRQVATTEQIGRAMLALARHGGPQRILETPAIEAAAQS